MIENKLKFIKIKNEIVFNPETLEIFVTKKGKEVFGNNGLIPEANEAKKRFSFPFSLNINLTPRCELACKYCFAKGGNYGTIIEKMDNSFIPLILKTFEENKQEKLRCEFFGGEPLLNFEILKEINEEVKVYCSKNNIEYTNRISTNLTTLTEEARKYLIENGFIVSVSIDGNSAVHDNLRPFKNGNGSFSRIYENLSSLRKSDPERKCTIVARMTWFNEEEDIFENIKKLLGFSLFDYVSLYPAIITNKINQTRTKGGWRKNLIKLVENYPKLKETNPIFKGIIEIEQIVNQLLFKRVSRNYCAAGLTYFTLSSDRKYVECHRFAGNSEFSAETIGQCNQLKSFADFSPCSACTVRKICAGGCKHEHYSYLNSYTTLNPDFCDYQESLVQTILENFELFIKEQTDKRYTLVKLFSYCGRNF